MSSPIRIGLVGLGRAGWGMHTRELEGREDLFKIVAACDVIEQRALGAQAHYEGCKAYTAIEELVRDPEVELVDIATRSPDHVHHTRLALEAGKIVFLEKPISVNFAQAMALERLDREYPGKIYVRHNRRFDPDFIAVKEVIASGVLGEIYEIRLARHNYQRRDDWQAIQGEGGGQLLNWGPHIVDHAMRLLESPLMDMYAHLACVAALGDAEDHVKIILRGENKRIVDLEISGGVTLPEPLYRVFGRRGTMTLDYETMHLKYLDPAQQLQQRSADPGTPADAGKPYHVASREGSAPVFGNAEALQWIEETRPAPQGDNYIIWNHLYAAIREGKPFPITMAEALENVRVLCKAREISKF